MQKKFEDAWSKPTPEKLVDLLDEDVVLFQPHLPAIRGKDNALREFERLFKWLPELHGIVDSSLGTDESVFIEWQMKLPVGNNFVSIRTIDRFRLKKGLGVERVVYFNQLAFIKAILTHPFLWPGYVRYRYGSHSECRNAEFYIES